MDGLPAHRAAAVPAGARNARRAGARRSVEELLLAPRRDVLSRHAGVGGGHRAPARRVRPELAVSDGGGDRSEEHTSELQSQSNLVCRLLLEKKKHPDGIGAIAADSRTPAGDA